MNTLTALPNSPSHLVQRLIIIALAGLFIFYHVTMLIDFARGFEESSSALYNALQTALRVGIIVSLTLAWSWGNALRFGLCGSASSR